MENLVKHLLLAIAIWLALAMGAARADGGTAGRAADGSAAVDRLEERDRTGGWRVVVATNEALRERDGIAVPLASATELRDGDRVLTHNARVRILLRGSGFLLLEPDTAAVLGPRTVRQQFGDILYQMKGTFTARFQSVEMGVQGTRFRVRGGPASAWEEGRAPVELSVAHGAVRVSNGGAAVTVETGETTTVRHGEGPLAPFATPAAAAAAMTALGPALDGGQWGGWEEPTFSLGAFGGVALFDSGVSGTTRLVGRLQLLHAWELSLAAGASSDATRFHLDQRVGIARELGPFAIGVAGLGALGPEGACPAPDAPVTFRLGFGATARGRLALSRRVAVEAELVGGWIEPGAAIVNLSAGVTLGF